ncbi:MAG: ATP-dependent helicase [Verrucomicrobia bacterium]|nr:ATP-dependent helicase [Verrucomicrobiota bacterium]
MAQKKTTTDHTAPQTAPWLLDLNPEQRQAVTHAAGHLLVVAGAGSGKTRTLASRVAHLIANGTDPGRILLLTFTRRAAQEMLKRAEACSPAPGAASRVWGGTFHATANRLLRVYAKPAGLSADFTVMDQGDAEDQLNVLRQEQGLHAKEKRFPRKSTCLAVYSRCVNGTEDIAEVLRRHFPWCANWSKELKILFQAYVTRKQERNVLDYDDLLLYWAELLTDSTLARDIGGRFDHILVDEYQDTNSLQARILGGMATGGARIMAVGDDAQSIYSFRAANVRNMLDFPKQFPGTTVVTLSQNYRSITPILATTNALIGQAQERFTKDLWSTRGDGQKPLLVTCKEESDQDRFIVERVLAHREEGIPLREQAVLFRAAHHSASLELELARRNIPYHKYGGLRFLEFGHIKDLIAFLRIVENPRDDMAWFRVLQLLPGVGPGIAARALRHVTEANRDPAALATFTAPASAVPALQGLALLLGEIYRTPALPPATQVERIRTFYDPLLKERYENAGARARDLQTLEQLATGYRSRRNFLSDLQLDPPTSTSELAGVPLLDEDWLVLSTIHSAKGCEWDVVHVMHASDGCLPSDMATGSPAEIEEELRLTYVAMTRARNFLYVEWPMRYYHTWHRHTDRHIYAQLSRFFSDAVRGTMQEAQSGADGSEDPAASDATARPIADRIRSRWA